MVQALQQPPMPSSTSSPGTSTGGWPITREARIEELQKLDIYFEDTLQKCDVKAKGVFHNNENDVPEDGGFVWVQVSVYCLPPTSRLINSLEGGPEGLYTDSSIRSQRFRLLKPPKQFHRPDQLVEMAKLLPT